MGKICVVGDFISDIYLNCKPKVNPEGDIPCYTIINQKTKDGGAANVKKNLKSLGSKSDLICAGKKSVKTRIFVGDKYIFRIDDDSAKDNLDKFSKNEKKTIRNIIIGKYDYIIVSDYNKGTITKNVAKVIMNSGAVVIVDCKPNHFKWFKGCYLIKPNEKEFVEMSNLGLTDDWFQNILITRGARGMILSSGKTLINFPRIKTTPIDVTGAGDIVISTLVHFLNKGTPLIESVKLANKAAAISIQYTGFYPISKKELLNQK